LCWRRRATTTPCASGRCGWCAARRRGRLTREAQATSGICYRTLQFPDSQINKLEITPDKQYLAAAGNPVVRLYEVSTGNPQPITTFEGHTGNVTAVGFERDGRWMYTGSEDGTVKIWDLRASGYQREYESRGAVNSVVLHPNQARPLLRARAAARNDDQLHRPSLMASTPVLSGYLLFPLTAPPPSPRAPRLRPPPSRAAPRRASCCQPTRTATSACGT